MSRPQRSRLAETQRELDRLVVAPSGVSAALGDDESAAARLAELVRSDDRLAAADRLEVYANAYFYRIRDCLADDFGTLLAGLGADLFHDLITAYLLAHRPRHPSLRFAGDRLADYLTSAGAAPFRNALPYAADLARLEWMLVTAFDAADAPVLPREALAAVEPERWAGLCFELQPAFQLASFDFPVASARRAFDRGEPHARLEARATRVVVWRTAEQVSYRTLEPLEADALTVIAAGESFGSLCERVAREVGDDAAPSRAAALLARWQNDGLLAQLVAALSQP